MMYYEEAGSGTPLVLVHGYPLDHTIWFEVAPVLAQRARVILPDLRGFGRTPARNEVSTMARLADDLRDLLDELGIARALVAGHSMGGYAALAFARAYPERLLGLALVASQPFADAPERQALRRELAEQALREGTGAVVATMAENLVCKPEWVAPLRALVHQASPLGVAMAQYGMAEREDLAEFMLTLDVPVWVLLGEQDKLVPQERVRQAASRLRRGRLVTLAGAAHMPMMENAPDTAGALLEWIEQGVQGGL